MCLDTSEHPYQDRQPWLLTTSQCQTFKTSHERYLYAKKTFWHFGEMLNWDKLLCTFMRTYLSKSSLEWDWIYQILRLIISDNHDFWRRVQACACISISFFVSLIWSNPTPYQSRQPWLLKATWSSLYFQIGIDVNTSLLYFPLPLPIQSTFDVKAALKRLLFKTIIKIMILLPETVG